MLQLTDCIDAFIDEVDSEPYQPVYRRQSFGSPVVGWSNRLSSYFWPKPSVGLRETEERLQALLARGEELSLSLPSWTQSQREMAVKFALEVFQWGGVRQRLLDCDMVQSVFEAAHGGNSENVPMNSGWCKVAALATAHLESVEKSQAICDSRVAWSIVRRMDGILHRNKCQQVPSFLNGIGKILGRGGNRQELSTRLRWPTAYRSWDSHFATTKIVREIKRQLNIKGYTSLHPTRGELEWDVRSVEMVLFMDGY